MVLYRTQPSRSRKYLIVASNPSCRAILGSHSSRLFASSMSGRRCFGSSVGSGRKVMVDFDLVNSITFSASSRIVNSSGSQGSQDR